MFDFYDEADRRLAGLLEPATLLDGLDVAALAPRADVRQSLVHYPDAEYGFLHEAAVIAYRGALYASWYNCPASELRGRTPIRARRSMDGGRTWSAVEVIDDDPSGRILFCPPVYGVDGGRLYMLANEMVAPDHIHALNLYRLDGRGERFEKLWSRPIPFKLNTNVVRLPGGRLMLPGRVAELDGFPNTPAALISDSGRIDADWRLVYIQPDGSLPDGSKLVHPELSAVVLGETVWMFCRDDERRVPLVYRSDDAGESWRGPFAHDIPFSASKIYAGTLSDGRNYVIGNLYPGRARLALLFSRPGEMAFTDGCVLQDGFSPELGFGTHWHYPAACEADGTLYVIYTANVCDGVVRGAAMSAVPLRAR